MLNEYRLILNEYGGVENGIIRIKEHECILLIIIPVGTTFHSPFTTIITDHPYYIQKNDEFDFHKTYSIMEDYILTLRITTPGAWFFQLSLNENNGPIIRFLVDTYLLINNKKVFSNGLNIQTNYGRCVGHVKDWVTNLRPLANLGYNMIHFPPIQDPGSRSHYSLRDQMQISRDLFPPNFPEQNRWPLLINTLKDIEKELNLGFMIDIVLNHTHETTPWLLDHPECGYNEETSPWLKPAIFLDDFIYNISGEIEKGLHPINPNLPKDQISNLRNYLFKTLINSDFKKFFIIDIDLALKEYHLLLNKELPKEYEIIKMRSLNYTQPQKLNLLKSHGILNDGLYDINSMKIDPYYSVALYSSLDNDFENQEKDFIMAINSINAPFLQQLESVINEALNNIMGAFSHQRYEGNYKGYPISLQKPITTKYFRIINFKNNKKLHFACNGWLFSENPTDDFASPQSDVYLKRKLVSWGDCVKLRYGNCRDDNPWLWDYMTEYCESVAKIAHAIRIDNAHSTPLPLAEYCIKAARRINPHLFIMAELFTSGENEDIEIINRIGINGFMREGLFRNKPSSMAHLLTQSAGSFHDSFDTLDNSNIIYPVKQIPAVIFDITHDNLINNDNRLILISSISMALSPISSTRGFDDMLSFNPCVVSEYRLYPLGLEMSGLHYIRAILNYLHREMSNDNLNELSTRIYGNTLTILRSNSLIGKGIWMVIRFDYSDDNNSFYQIPCPLPISDLIFESKINSFELSNEMKSGKCNYDLNNSINKLFSCKIENNNLILNNFPNGSVVCFRVEMTEFTKMTINDLKTSNLIVSFSKLIDKLNLIDLNYLLYKSEPEEHINRNCGLYDFPNYGKCFYAGIQGILTILKIASKSPEGMNHPIYKNIRDGNWLIDYICSRLSNLNQFKHLEQFLRITFNKIITFPRELIPKFLNRCLNSLVISINERIFNLMTLFIKNGDDFIKKLALSSVSLYGHTNNAPLIQNHLQHFYQKNIFNFYSCLAAGLPHFSTGFMRSWGRDTFISLRGIFLITGRFNEAKDHLIAYASCLRHGLIPNLLDGCNKPRYNARDSTWWFLQALQDYYEMAPDGNELLNLKIPKLFPTNNKEEFENKYLNSNNRPIVTISDIIYEILTSHGNGIHFKEWDAGNKIDSQMKNEGFQIDIITDWNTGFIYGGNEFNCGTWMDKMGSSIKANNKGQPATPRNGAAIEIIGLLASTLRWLSNLCNKDLFQFPGIYLNNNDKFITWKEWHNLLIANFERWFYIPSTIKHDKFYVIESSLVNIRGIYKDLVGSTHEYEEYQFRPNLLIAMTVAPELFDPIHANRCLNLVDERLTGKIGMKTLDPSDFRYKPNYINIENEDYFTSNGFNYHNGPEWVWLTGYFFRATMRMRKKFSLNMMKILSSLKGFVNRSKEFGIPELTNENGNFCFDSCPIQAWSIACTLDILFDYSQYSEKEILNWEITLNSEDED